MFLAGLVTARSSHDHHHQPAVAVARVREVHIGYEAAKKAKKLALGDDLQSQAAQFAKLPSYADAIRTADPEVNAIATLLFSTHSDLFFDFF